MRCLKFQQLGLSPLVHLSNGLNLFWLALKISDPLERNNIPSTILNHFIRGIPVIIESFIAWIALHITSYIIIPWWMVAMWKRNVEYWTQKNRWACGWMRGLFFLHKKKIFLCTSSWIKYCTSVIVVCWSIDFHSEAGSPVSYSPPSQIRPTHFQLLWK